MSQSEGQGKWLDIFKGSDLRRTEIVVFVWVLQNFSGAIFAGNTTYVFQQAGISQDTAYSLGWGTSAIQLGANFLNMYLLYVLGRRTIYLFGFLYCGTNLLIVGVASVYGIRGDSTAKWIQAGVQMVSDPRGKALNTGFHDRVYWLSRSDLLCDH
jgi:SP family general alpha glucoside:H+ symporter-like MFS transporter